jgi:Uma2 family endonuclease
VAMAVAIPRYRFTVDEYHKMAQAGIFTEDDRVELLEGEIVTMAAIGPRHAATVERTARFFTFRLGERALVRSQNPLRIGEHSEPEPDVALTRWRDDYYAGGHPTPEDTFLIIEVADTSLRLDREVKIPIYAGCSVTEVWLADVDDGTLHVFRVPEPTGYKVQRVLRRGQSIAPEAFPDVSVRVEELLGP